MKIMEKIENKINDKLLVAQFAVWGGVTSLFSAGEFDVVDGTIDEGFASVDNAVGQGASMFLAWAPIVLLMIGVILGVKQAKKSSEQEQENSGKVWVTAGIAGTIGAIIGILIIALFGGITMQDPAKGFEAVSAYWERILGL